MKLMAPNGYKNLTENEKNRMGYGCGPEFLTTPQDPFLEACHIHDFEYSVTEEIRSSEHRKSADVRFLENMLGLARAQSPPRRWISKARAYIYYAAVRTFGSFFYGG